VKTDDTKTVMTITMFVVVTGQGREGSREPRRHRATGGEGGGGGEASPAPRPGELFLIWPLVLGHNLIYLEGEGASESSWGTHHERLQGPPLVKACSPALIYCQSHIRSGAVT
jgi:hypothetical protein